MEIYKHPKMLYIASLSELWERFSFYIVEALLVIYLINAKHLPQSESYQLVGTYIANSFILTVFGGYFGQNIIGFKASVHLGALLMAVGYAFLLTDHVASLSQALSLIVVGSAFFKPNMACFVGALYKAKNSARYAAAYNMYYAAIMVGVILSTSISGYVLHYLGWNSNFILATSAMLLAFIIFWMGNKITADRVYSSTELFDLGFLRWPITLTTCSIVWIFICYVLENAVFAQIEFIGCFLILGIVFLHELTQTDSKLKFIACLILLCLSGLYWALLFQQFFSFNIMINLLINKEIGYFHLPAPIFMGFESFFVIVFSGLLARWGSRKNIQMNIFNKYTLAFAACFIGLVLLYLALYFYTQPYFTWIILAYAFIGLGEAILAPTALAMIAMLNREKMIGVMMASLYIFWGLGTKMADVFAQWSIVPENVQDPILVNACFRQATLYYSLIAGIVCLLCFLGARLFALAQAQQRE
jgi:POT family proton-dependent oligopeptide transporter